MKNVHIEEKTLQLALVKAAGQLGVTQHEIEYRVVEEKKGFLGFIGKKISITAWKKTAKGSLNANKNERRRDGRRSDERTERSSSSRSERHERSDRKTTARKPSDSKPRIHRKERNPEREVQQFSPEELTNIAEEIKIFTHTLLEKMFGVAINFETEIVEDRLIVNIHDEDLAQQISKSLKVAEALEHLLRKAPKQVKQELPFRIFVDAKGVRKAREAELMDMAQDLSNKVFENKRPIVLNYKNPYDRKIIHMALDKDDRVYTKSIGNGPHRKLMILPSKGENQEVNG